MTSFARIQLQPAYVIHQRPYRDTSAIVEIFSEAHGRQALVAKGLKRPKSKLRGLLQPFQPLLISWMSKSELGTLTDAELYSHVTPLNSKYLPSAFYLNELLLKLLHKDDPHEDIFVAYHNTLGDLQKLSGKPEDELVWQCYLRRFEISLLQSLGYGLVLDHDVVDQAKILADKQYDYILDHGPVLLASENEQSRGIIISGQALLLLTNQSRMLQLAQQDTAEGKALYKEAKKLLRAVIDHQLGNKSLHSRELFANVAAQPVAQVE